MIKKLGIQNFKSVKDLTLECNRVNIFIGEPNTGKSNILEALGLASWCAYGVREDEGPSTYIHYSENMFDTATATTDQSVFENQILKKTDSPSLHQFMRFKNLENIFHDGNTGTPVRISIDGQEIDASITDNQFNVEFVKGKAKKPENISTLNLAGNAIRKGTRRKDLGLIKFYRFIDHVTFPAPDSAFLLPPDGRNLFSVVAKHTRFQEEMSNLFSVVPFEFVLNTTEKQFEFHKKTGNIVKSYPYIIASDTLRHIAFFMIAIESNHNSTIVLEEPEVHAFPYYVKWLAERIALYSDNQFFIATHNPYLLSAIIEKTRCTELAVNITHLEDNQTKITQLDGSRISELIGIDPFFNLDSFIAK